MEQKIIGIYKITSPSGRVYIGQSRDAKHRWYNDYKYKRCKSQTKLYRSLNKHGWEAHQFEIIEECVEELLNERELFWGLFYNVLDFHKGLNLKLGNANGKVSEETKRKISKSQTGKTHSEAVRKTMGRKKGSKYTEGEKEQMSIKQKKANKNRLEKLEGRIGKWNIGKTRTTNHIEKLIENTRKAIIQICPKTNKVINEFISMKEAGRILGINANGITEVIQGRQKTSHGYIWKLK